MKGPSLKGSRAAATSSSSKQQLQAAATSSSYKQQIQAAAPSSSYKQQLQAAAATSSSSKQQQLQAAAATSSSSYKQQIQAAATSSSSSSRAAQRGALTAELSSGRRIKQKIHKYMVLEALSRSYCTLLHSAAHTQPHYTIMCMHTFRWWHTKRNGYVHTHTNKHTPVLQPAHARTQTQWPRGSFEMCDFLLLLSRTIWGTTGREKVQQRCRLSSYLFIKVHVSPCRQPA